MTERLFKLNLSVALKKDNILQNLNEIILKIFITKLFSTCPNEYIIYIMLSYCITIVSIKFVTLGYAFLNLTFAIQNGRVSAF